MPATTLNPEETAINFVEERAGMKGVRIPLENTEIFVTPVDISQQFKKLSDDNLRQLTREELSSIDMHLSLHIQHFLRNRQGGYGICGESERWKLCQKLSFYKAIRSSQDHLRQYENDKPALDQQLMLILHEIDFDGCATDDASIRNPTSNLNSPLKGISDKDVIEVKQLECGIYRYRMNHGKVNKFETIGDYYIMNTIGNGTYGKVRLAIKTSTKEKFAVKIIPRAALTAEEQKSLNTEIEVQGSLSQHPNITRLYEVYMTNEEALLFLEYASGGDLWQYVNQHSPLKETEVKRMICQLLSALDYCHEVEYHASQISNILICKQRNVYHRDIKLENLLLDKHGNIKLTDFGFGRQSRDLLKTYCGSVYYIPPEIIKGVPYSGAQADIWSAAVVLYACLTGDIPFYDADERALNKQICKGKYNRDKLPNDEVRRMVGDMLRVNPKKRLYDIRQVMCYPWLRDEWQRLIDLSDKQLKASEKVYDATNNVDAAQKTLDASLPGAGDPLRMALKSSRWPDITSNPVIGMKQNGGTDATIAPSNVLCKTKKEYTPLMHENLRVWLKAFLALQSRKPWSRNHNYHQPPPVFAENAKKHLERQETGETVDTAISGESQQGQGNSGGLRRLKNALRFLFRTKESPSQDQANVSTHLETQVSAVKDIDGILATTTAA